MRECDRGQSFKGVQRGPRPDHRQVVAADGPGARAGVDAGIARCSATDVAEALE